MTIPQPKTRDDLIALLSITDPDELQALYDAAYAVKAAGVGRVVYYRGLVEFSNYCIKDCKYCGIRKSNDEVERFDTPREDILAMARWAWENRYGSLTLQSGERQPGSRCGAGCPGSPCGPASGDGRPGDGASRRGRGCSFRCAGDSGGRRHRTSGGTFLPSVHRRRGSDPVRRGSRP